MSTNTLEAQEKELEQLNNPILESARSLQVRSAAEYVQAQEVIKNLKTAMQRVNNTFNPDIDRAHKLHKSLIKTKNDFYHPLELTCSALIQRTNSWKREQERIQEEEEAKLRAAAQQIEEERKFQEALALENAGEPEAAAQIIEEETPAPMIVLPAAVPKVEGISFRENWHAEVFDFMQLIKAVADGKVPILALQPNMVHLNQQARSMKQLLNYPGVKAVSEEVQNTKP